MLLGSHKVGDEARTLDELTADLLTGISEVAQGMHQINTAVVRVSEIGAENKRSIDSLAASIRLFKVS
jgi:hypothetical protein